MQYREDEKHSPRVSFTILKKQMTQIYAAERFSGESVFRSFLTKSQEIAIQQSHIINPLLTSFTRSALKRITFGFYCTNLAPSSLGLYEKPQAKLSRTDLALG